MVKLTQSLSKWLFDNHRDKFSLIRFGHVELLTEIMWKEYIESCKTADEDGSARRELYPGTAGLIRKWHGEGMTPEEIANLLERDLRQVKEVLDDA